MPTCPNCNFTGRSRRRQCCPHCGVHLYIYRKGRGKKKETMWVYDQPSCRDLVKHLRDQVRVTRGAPLFDFEDWIPELGMAKTLLDKCDGDQELAVRVIDQYFTDVRGGIWVQPQSMAQVIWSKPSGGGAGGCFNLALAYAKGEQAREQEKWQGRNLEQETMFD